MPLINVDTINEILHIENKEIINEALERTNNF
jgi:hypothetical protein